MIRRVQNGVGYLVKHQVGYATVVTAVFTILILVGITMMISNRQIGILFLTLAATTLPVIFSLIMPVRHRERMKSVVAFVAGITGIGGVTSFFISGSHIEPILIEICLVAALGWILAYPMQN
jgi:hypothetical protein